ncbi:MAG: ABC transporter substrate-binding protein [Gemmataceae bacterium]
MAAGRAWRGGRLLGLLLLGTAVTGLAAPPNRRAEEEDDRPPVRREVLRLDEQADKQPKPPPRVDQSGADLPALARSTKHAKVKELFAALAVPADEVTLRSFPGVKVDGLPVSGRFRVEPLPAYIPDLAEAKGRIPLRPLPTDGQEGKAQEISPNLVGAIRYYELFAAERVKEFLDRRFDPADLSRDDQLTAAEQALAAVLRSTCRPASRGVREGPGGMRWRPSCGRRLLGVYLAQLDRLTERRAWDAGFALAVRVAGDFRRKGEGERLVGPVAVLLRGALNDPTFPHDRLRDARARLRVLEDQFPNSPILKPIGDALRDQAQRLLDRARQLVKEDRKDEALEQLRRAEDLWPELPGLRTYRLGTDQSYRILRVAVRDLPRYLSPAWATTDAELRAVELLFESLVVSSADERGALSYRTQLAEGRPQVIPLGREFKLPRQGYWSDGKPLTVGDLRFTVAQQQEGKGTGRSAGWGELLDRLQVEGDPFRLKLRLKQGFLDPLAPMAFKVLPARSRPHPASKEFAQQPISSGPFVYDAGEPGAKRDGVTFRANPYYAARADKGGLPRIREVRFVTVAPEKAKDGKETTPAAHLLKAFKDRTIDLAADLTAREAAELAKAGFEVPLPSAKTPNRRVSFLAVNHRKPPLANADLRVALARAIPRETILDAHFRADLGRKVHKALNGPYPAGSWACDPTLVSRTDRTSLDPHDPDLARTKWKQALTRLSLRDLRLSLKYPSGDSTLKAALEAMAKAMEQTLPGLTVALEERTPYELREDVEETHSYELAYYHYDFPDQAYWLHPLLGPAGRNGAENYLGYTGPLVSRIQAAMTVRNFVAVRDYAQAIHRQLLEAEMPLIPLWQLDPLYAYPRGELELPPIDPQALFTQVEEWRVLRR